MADSDDPDGGDGGRPERATDAAGSSPRGQREVEVPMALYKVVTVFSTLLSILFVVLGFGVLSAAARVASNPPGSLVGGLLILLGVPTEQVVASKDPLALVVGLVGLGLVAGGAGVYVYGSRFKAPGMGKPKDEADEAQGDG